MLVRCNKCGGEAHESQVHHIAAENARMELVAEWDFCRECFQRFLTFIAMDVSNRGVK